MRFQLGYSAANNFYVRNYDMSNAFQCTYEPDPTKRVYCYLPPLYIHWYNYRYPWDKIDPTKGPYVLQAGQVIQGTPHAGRSWYKNIDTRLKNHEYKQNSTDNALYIRKYKNEIVSILTLTIDDCLVYFKDPTLEKFFFSFMSAAYEVTTPGKQDVIKFLSCRIVQSNHGISVDQSQHIQQNILRTWFPVNGKVKKVHTPFDHDPTFEHSLGTTPAIKSDTLPKYEREYHGEFRSTVGKILHVQQWTRGDLSFAIARLAAFNTCPNHYAFLGLKRIIRYLHTHPHEPLFYPSVITAITDAAFANVTPDRRSMEANILTINGVAYSWTANIQRGISKDSTEAEVRATFRCTVKIIALRNFLTSSAFFDLLQVPPTMFIDSTATIKVITSNKVSSRTRHLDVSVNFPHEYIQFGYYKPEYIHRSLNMADALTKATPAPVLSFHWDTMRGRRFYPPTTTPHGHYLSTMTDLALQHLNDNKK